ncbi:uncharacterized protein [Littorina saxatilis]|uniref:uncharacterized protein n=1 Tax=Littorina saxatilis TaxID=31220 RepID=UPI0038B4D55A
MADPDKRKGKSDLKGKVKPKSSSTKPLVVVSDEARNTILTVPISPPGPSTVSRPSTSAVTPPPPSAAPEQGAIVASFLSSLLPEIRSMVQTEMQRASPSASAFLPAEMGGVRSLASVVVTSASGLHAQAASASTTGVSSKSDRSGSPREAFGHSLTGNGSLARGHSLLSTGNSTPYGESVAQLRCLPSLARTQCRSDGFDRELASGLYGSQPQFSHSSFPPPAVSTSALPASAGHAVSHPSTSAWLQERDQRREVFALPALQPGRLSLPPDGVATSSHVHPVASDGFPSYPMHFSQGSSRDHFQDYGFPVSGHPAYPAAGVLDDYGHGTSCDHSEVQSVASEEPPSGMSSRLRVILDTAAEVTSRYFPEGTAAAVAPTSGVPSAMSDFLPAKEANPSFRFAESPAIAYHLSQVWASAPRRTGGVPSDPVPFLVPFGTVPEQSQPWLATMAQTSTFVPLPQRKLALPRHSRNLVASYALPRSVLPVTPDLTALLAKPVKGDSVIPVKDSTLLSLEEVGRQLLELASISDTLIRALSRSLTDDLVPFTLSEEQNADDVSSLLTALAKVNEEQTRLSSLQYAHAVLARRELFLANSQFAEQVTRDTLRVSPVVEGSLFSQMALVARQQEIQSNKDSQFLDMTLQGMKQAKPSQQGKSQPASHPKPAQKRPAQQSSRGGKKRMASGRGRGGSSSKPHPQ